MPKHFTKDEIRELWQQFAVLGVRDTDLDDANSLNGDEYVAIVQDGVNRKVLISTMFGQYITEDILEHVYRGKSAYEIAVEHGFVGTEEEWLSSLQGADGAQGAQGAIGPQGPKGDPGEDGSAYNLPVATSAALGGIKIGYTQNNKNYPVQLDAQQKAFVNVPWTGGGGGDAAGYYEIAFKAVDSVGVPDLPPNGVVLDPSTGWDHYAPNNTDGTKIIWMTNRFIDANGAYNNWQGPWRISGAEGEAGVDGDYYEYIYTRTTSESVTPTSPNSGIPSPSSPGRTVADDDFVPQDWFDNPSGVTVSLPVEWMAMRIKQHTDSNPEGTWSLFIGPVVWSKYGVNGTDGDGVEYIYYAGSTYPLTEPSTWTNDENFQNREYIRPGSGWSDNPIDLEGELYGPGTKQWVCVRKKYLDSGATEPTWHAYSDATLWSYYALDGDAGIGVVADIDNDTMAIALDSNGDNYAFNQNATAVIYNGAGTLASSITAVTVKDSNGTSYPSQTWVTYTGNVVTVSIPAGAVNLADKHLLVTITLSGTLSGETVNRNVVLSLIGVHFGADGDDGVSYRLVLNSSSIRQNKSGVNAPTAILPTCVKVKGDGTAIVSANPSQIASLIGSAFSIRYAIDGGSEVALTTDSGISTSTVTDHIRVELDYNNILIDQETVYINKDGIDGKYITTIVEYYAVSTDGRNHPTTGWEAGHIPTFTQVDGVTYYLWNFERTYFDNGTYLESDYTVLSAFKNGVGITEVNNYYIAHNSDVRSTFPAQSTGGVVGYGWAKNDPSLPVAVIGPNNRYLLNFEEIKFSDGTSTLTETRVLAVYVDTDIEYIKSVFGKNTIDNRNSALLAGYLGVVDSDDNTKIDAMINGTIIGADSTHGKLLISSGFGDLAVASGSDGTFRVYEDGFIFAKNAQIEGNITANSGSIGKLGVTQDGIDTSFNTTNGVFSTFFNENGFYIESTVNNRIYSSFSVDSLERPGQAVVEIIAGDISGREALYVSGDTRILGDTNIQGDVTILGNSNTFTATNAVITNATITNLTAPTITNKRVTFVSSSQVLSLTYDTYVVGGSNITLTHPESQESNGFVFMLYANSAFTLSSQGIITYFGGSVQSYSGTVSLNAGYCYTVIYDGRDCLVTRSA